LWTETPFSRDFLLIGSSYFQLLGAFCSVAEASLESAQQIFIDTEFISDYMLAPSRFVQETQAIIDTFVTTTNNNIEQDYNWISVAFRTSFFLSGTNINFVAVVDDDTIYINKTDFYVVSVFDHDSIAIDEVCSCGTGLSNLACQVVTALYSNGSDFNEFDQVFWEINIGCLPILGFMDKTTSWWYDLSYLDNIKESYSTFLYFLPLPDIAPLNLKARL
jgi:hypothetical protein